MEGYNFAIFVSLEEIGSSLVSKAARAVRIISPEQMNVIVALCITGHIVVRPHISKIGVGTARLVVQLTGAPKVFMGYILSYLSTFCQFG